MFGSWLPTRTLVTIGPVAIQWYGFFAALGALAAYLLGRQLVRWARLPDEQFGDLFVTVLVIGLIGARLWHVVGDFGYYRNHLADILAIWKGGLAIHGGLLAGAITLAFSGRRQGGSFWLLADVFAPAIALGEAIGRWGNYFNQELFGQPTKLPWGIPIGPVARPAGLGPETRFHPAFLYESLGLIAIAVLLTILFRWRARRVDASWPFFSSGSILALFLVSGGLLRTGIETLRIDPVLSINSVRVPMLVSLLMVVIGLTVLLRNTSRPPTPTLT